jgi:hypothetical protein
MHVVSCAAIHNRGTVRLRKVTITILREQVMLGMPARIMVKLYRLIGNGTLDHLVGFFVVACSRDHHQAGPFPRRSDMWQKLRQVLLVWTIACT